MRALIKKWAPKIASVLERYLKSSDQEAISDELKELFSPDTIGY